MQIRRFLSFIVAAAVFTLPAYGHHAITLNYNPDKTGTIDGVVEEVFWSNPHVHYYMTVTHEDGSKETWDVETGNVRGMTRDGITRDTIKPGDRLTISGTLGRDGAKRILADSIVRPDGTVLRGEGYGE